MDPMFSGLLVWAATSTAGIGAPDDPSDLASRIGALEEELEALRLASLDTFVETVTPAAETQALPNIFNPTLTVFGSGLYRFDHRASFNLREVEIDLRAAVDPHADGVVIVAFESEVPGEFEAAVEEGFITIKRLPIPILDEPPLGLKLKVGRFRTEIGRINRLHLHDLPHVFRPLVIEELFGPEGFVASGVSAQFFLPSPSESSALELTLQAVAGGGVSIADSPARFPGFVGNLRWFSAIADDHQIDLSLVFHAGRTDDAGDLWATTYAADVLYKWKPLRRGEYRSFLIGGEVFYARRRFLEPVDATPEAEEQTRRTAPFGYFAFTQIQLSRGAYVGARFDDTRTIADDDAARRAISGYLTLYASEFLRFRLGYEHRFSADEEARLHSAFAELTFVFGAHPPEPFWVNR